MNAHNLYIIGLTGNIACGKSTVVALLQEYGAKAIDADDIVRQVQEPGTHVYRQMEVTFGSEYFLFPGGPLDRRKLGALVFQDPHALQRLEHIVHPSVHARIVLGLSEIAREADSRKLADPSLPVQVAVIDAIKLLEAGWKYHCRAIWVVTATEEQQIQRLMETRGLSKEEAEQRIASQPSQASRIAFANVVIDNSGSREETRKQVEAAWNQIITTG